MLCPQCGVNIDSTYTYCPSCGVKLAPSPSPESTPAHSAPPLVEKKPMPFWFKLLVFLAVIALIGVTAGILFTEHLVDVVDKQLESLRQDDVRKAYYAYTSKEFQNTTSLEQFRDFIQAYPVFLNNQSAHFTQRSIDNHIMTIKGNLTSQDHVSTPIEYKVIKEGDQWKILSIRLLKPTTIQNAKEGHHIEDLIDVVKAQLKEIQEHHTRAAYQDYTSREFKEATSEEAFRDFIKRYPILADHHVVSFHKPTIRNGVGTLSVIVQSNQFAAYVKYYLIHEDQTWKIWSMRILSPSMEREEREKKQERPSTKPSNVPMSLGDITLGSQVDEQGLIKQPTTRFQSGLGDLYVDIEVKNGLKGSVIYLSLQHLESSSSIPAQADIEDNGDSLLMSVFSPPGSGWPKGNYKLVITTSSGLTKVIDFVID